MATKDRKKLQHIHSSIADKQPTPQSLEVGEIAVNNSAKKEFLSIKNSDDKVVRFSSDSTIIDWIEKKEVMPYSGVVDNVHLDTNRSNIEIKINQVAAKNTPKYDKINGAVDIDGQPINPSTEGGKEDGAGIAIDMSRYAMIGANPSFSSITVTDKSDLSGNTTIANGDGTGTRTGHTLAIKTTDVTANDTNWTETIANRTSTVTNETNKITTLNESATTRTTVVGTENLTISGATTENKTGNVVENNLSDKTESTAGVLTENNNSNHIINTNGTTNITRTGVVTEDNKNNVTRTTSGSTTETFKGQVTENNLANKTENTTGAHNIYSTSNTCINSQANANFYGKVNTNIGVACDGTTKGSATTVVGTTTLNMSGATTTISGNTTNVTGATTLNISGVTINEKANTANTNVTSAYTSATTATTVIGTANTSATTATLSGNTLDITEATRFSAKTPSTYVSGTTLDIKENNTDIESCGRISGKTNAFTIQECTAGNGKTVINQTDIKASGKTLSFDETTSISAKTPTTTLSGTNLNVTEATSTINSTDTNLNGGNLNVNESGNTAINTVGTTNIKSTGNTNVETNGANNKVTIQASGTGGDVEVFAKDTLNETGGTVNITSTNNTNISAKDFCVKGSTSASIGAPTTNIGKACDNSIATTINISGTTINEGGTTNNNNFTTINNTATTINNKANFNITGTTYISGNTTISGDTTIGGKLYLKPDCTSITSTTVNAGLCEVLDRSAITIEKNTNPSDPQLATIYTIKQNGVAINTIEVAKDQFLQDAKVVKNTSDEWVIRLTWWIYDPDSGTHTTTTTDVNASELVKDLTAVNPDDNGTAANHNVKVSSWYDSASGDMKFSAETTPNMHVTNIYASNTVSGATVSGTNITASAAMRANNISANTISANTITGAMSKKLTWAAGAFTADTTGYNGSVDKTITVPTAISHLATRGKLTITHNGLSDTYDPASDKSMTLPHSALTINFGVATGQTNTSYNTSAGRTITIPTSTAHLSKATLTIDYNADVRSKSDTSYNTEAAATVSIPGSLDHLSNYDGTNININHPTKINGNVSVTGTITASGAIYSSDRNLKENIFDISENEFERIGFVKYKTYNFKGEDNKMYGVIAQDLQDAGLGEMVYSRDDGTLAVDYTSLMILQLARLKRDNENMLNHIAWLERRIEELEGGNKE